MRKLSYLFSGLRANRHDNLIWNGIHETFHDVPVSGVGFNSDTWIAATEQATRSSIESLSDESETIPYDIRPYHSLLAFHVALLASRQDIIRIVDFGGGMGLAYANLRRSLPCRPPLDYLVIDNNFSCEIGATLFANDPGIRFYATVPSELEDVDILFMGGVLQFVDNYQQLIRTLAVLQPRYWLYGFLPAGNIPTFASGQRNVPGSVIPVWFFHLPALLKEMEKIGYGLVFRAPMDRYFDMSNFPETHRLPYQCNLLFARHGCQ